MGSSTCSSTGVGVSSTTTCDSDTVSLAGAACIASPPVQLLRTSFTETPDASALACADLDTNI